MIKMFEWVNLSILISSLVLFSLLYTLSTMPVTLSEKFGQGAWKVCSIMRVFAMIFEFISLATLILWIWFPIEKIDWKISSHWWIGLFIALLILIPGAIVMTIGMKDAGKETASPLRGNRNVRWNLQIHKTSTNTWRNANVCSNCFCG